MFGAGYTSSTLKIKEASGKSKWTSRAVDFSLTPIDFLTVGYEVLFGGALKNGTAELKKASG